MRFLDVLGEYEPAPGEPATDPGGAFVQFKLLWLAGLAPHLDSCTACGDEGPLLAFSAAAGGAICENCRDAAAASVSGDALGGIRALLEAPLSGAEALAPGRGACTGDALAAARDPRPSRWFPPEDARSLGVRADARSGEP